MRPGPSGADAKRVADLYRGAGRCGERDDRLASSDGRRRCSPTIPTSERELVKDRSLIANAIEEVLRFESPAPHVGRCVAREDLTVRGTNVPAGSVMLFLLGSANRDDRRFPDGDTFDIRRNDGRHLTFGNGIHLCMGSALARDGGVYRPGRSALTVPRVGHRRRKGAAVPDLDRPRVGDASGGDLLVTLNDAGFFAGEYTQIRQSDPSPASSRNS